MQTSTFLCSLKALALSLLLTLSPNPNCDAIRIPNNKQPLNTNTNFIKTSCNNMTTYPALCFTSLQSYANQIQTSNRQLTTTALNVTLIHSRSASSAMTAMSAKGGMPKHVAAAMSDCLENVGDSIDQLKRSIQQMKSLGGSQMAFELANVQTWVSAALTDDDTCMDGFETWKGMDGEVKTRVRGYVLKLAQLTSNALAFINHLATN